MKTITLELTPEETNDLRLAAIKHMHAAEHDIRMNEYNPAAQNEARRKLTRIQPVVAYLARSLSSTEPVAQ